MHPKAKAKAIKRREMNSRFQSRVVPTRRAMPAACASVGAGKAMGRPGTGGVSSFQIFNLLGLVLFECIFAGPFKLRAARNLATERLNISRGSGRAFMKNIG